MGKAVKVGDRFWTEFGIGRNSLYDSHIPERPIEVEVINVSFVKTNHVQVKSVCNIYLWVDDLMSIDRLFTKEEAFTRYKDELKRNWL